MTLRTRNRFLLAMDIIATIVFSIFLASFIFFVIKLGFSTIPSLHRIFNLGETNIIVKNSPLASMLSRLILPFYVALFGLFIYISFEKTKSSEIIYLSVYFVACAMQGISILIPVFQLWEISSVILIFIGRVALAGQILASIAILLLTLTTGNENLDSVENNTDRNVWIGLCVSLFFASILPINTTKITSNFWLTTGFDIELFILFLMILLVSIVVFSIYTYKNSIKFFRSPALYVSILELGYFFLTECDNYLFLTLGTVFLFLGTYFFLHFLRRKYLWN
mgnify:CR=1 FL=1